MKHLHPRPDRTEKGLLAFNIGILIMLIVTITLYYEFKDDGFEHDPALRLSMVLGIFVGITVVSIIYRKFLRKHKGAKIVEDT